MSICCLLIVICGDNVIEKLNDNDLNSFLARAKEYAEPERQYAASRTKTDFLRAEAQERTNLPALAKPFIRLCLPSEKNDGGFASILKNYFINPYFKNIVHSFTF